MRDEDKFFFSTSRFPSRLSPLPSHTTGHFETEKIHTEENRHQKEEEDFSEEIMVHRMTDFEMREEEIEASPKYERRE